MKKEKKKKTFKEELKEKGADLAKKTASTLYTEAQDSGWLASAMVIVDHARGPVVKIGSRLAPKELVEAALNTEYGEAALSYGIGTLLPLSPWKEDKRCQRLGYELRVYGGAVLLRRVAREVFDPIRGIVTDVLSSLPDPEESDKEE